MENYRERVIDLYRAYDEDSRATSSRFNGMAFHYTKRLLAPYITPEDNVVDSPSCTDLADHALLICEKR